MTPEARDELILRHLDEETSPEEGAQVTHLLGDDADFRARFFAFVYQVARFRELLHTGSALHSTQLWWGNGTGNGVPPLENNMSSAISPGKQKPGRKPVPKAIPLGKNAPDGTPVAKLVPEGTAKPQAAVPTLPNAGLKTPPDVEIEPHQSHNTVLLVVKAMGRVAWGGCRLFGKTFGWAERPFCRRSR